MNFKRLILLLIIILTTPTIIFAQKNSVIKLLNKGEFQQAYEKIQTSYQDTNNIDRIEVLTLYYKDANNPEKDACLAYYYANKLNQLQGREIISTEEICKQELSVVYNTKDIESLEAFIECFQEETKYAKEAERLLEQISFERTQLLNTIEDYEKYIERHPNAIQANLARQAIDEMVSIQILESEDLEKLENFVKQTTNEKYKQQANQEIERIVFQIALEENTAKKYEDYIKRFPSGVYIKLAKEKLNDVLYNEVIVSSTLTSMISFIKNNTEHPRRQQILERLKEKSLKQLSIEGIKTVLEIENDTLLINKFIKDYLTDPTKENIALIEEAFPEQKSSKALQTAKTLNEDYNFLIRKTSINNNDLKNHRGLFFKKNNSLTFILLEKYFAQQKNNKNKDLRFESEITYNLSQSDNLSISLIDKEFEETDIVHSANKVFSAHTKDGYQPESSSRNEDIYIIKTNEVGNQDTILLPCSVNTRFNETSPMLSKDGKTLFFSSDAGLNHGGLDIYISHREDTTLTDNWSNPILLGSNINTNKNDYVVSLSEYKIVLANDNSTNQRTFLINDDLEFENAYVLDQKGKFLSEEVIVIDSTTLDTIYIVKSNENGYVSFLKPNKPYYLYAQKYGHISFFSEDNSQIVLQNIEELFSTKQFYLLDSPFNEKKLTEITPKGKRELEYLAKSLKDSKFVTTISVHVHSVNKTEKAQEISEKQVQIITDILIKNGVNKDNLIIASYANTSPLIGWEGKDRIEIGFLIEK
jgi:outer membrane protein OmpA-like peptidoglycan-associated protein